MHVETVGQATQHASLVAVGLAFLAGLVFSFNPVALASIPFALAYVTKGRTVQQSVRFGAAFVVGMVAAQVALGFIAGLGGSWAAKLVGRQWGLLLGPILILLGIVWAGWIRLPLPSPSFRPTRPGTLLGAVALGATFAIAVRPVCNPELIVLLGAAGAVASPLFGAALLLTFAIGRAIPIFFGASAIGWLENQSVLSRHRRAIELLGAATMIVMGLYMLNAYYFWIPGLAI
jgi:cytochrome c-type biogenesis protein